MALYPNKFTGQYKLQPGARGEKFKANLPGYRNDEERINRTNIRLNHNEHDTPNVKYMFDDRLPVLFKYGYAYGFNQIVIPKGRIVAVDPYRDLVDFDMKKAHNTLTLANGGAPVRLRTSGDTYKDYSGAEEKLVSSGRQDEVVGNIGIEWTPLLGMNKAYTQYSYRPFIDNTEAKAGATYTFKGQASQFTDAGGLKIDKEKGIVVDASGVPANVIPGNVPIGVLIRNEYTRDEDALNGIAPGAVNTDAMLELPWFAYKDKAEENPWGAAYGPLMPGMLVKSDENGRVVASPLSYEAEIATMSLPEYELERQQVIGQIYSVDTELVPEGAARWATWALQDRLDFQDFNPDEWPQNNRRGEDSIGRTPYKSSGEYPGYPYEKNYGAHDLHMMGGIRTNYNQRMQHEYQYENLGIPGLTDGYNAVNRTYDPVTIGTITLAKNITELHDLFFRFPEVNINEMKVKLGDATLVDLEEKINLNITVNGVPAIGLFEVKYADPLQALFVLRPVSLVALNAFTASEGVIPSGKTTVDVPVTVTFKKRGLAGVPTFMDWDGCCGSIKVLLQK